MYVQQVHESALCVLRPSSTLFVPRSVDDGNSDTSWLDPTNVQYVDENGLYSCKLAYQVGLCKFVD